MAQRNRSGRRRLGHAWGLAALLALAAGGGTTESSGPGGAPGDSSGLGCPSGWLGQVQEELQEQEYEVTWQETPPVEGIKPSWQAPNRSHGFRTYFTREGIRMVPRMESGPSWRWGLSLVGYGRGGRSWAVQEAIPSPSGHRVDYRRGGLEERYENSSRGLEQGFILSTPPEEHGACGETHQNMGSTVALRSSPASAGLGACDLVNLDLMLWGDLSPRVSEDGQAIDFVTPSGAAVLRYAQLHVMDARGESLPAWMEGFAGENGRGIRLVLDVRGASYPISIDPLTTGPSWTAESNQGGANFGFSVATAGDVNSDGFSDVIVGARYFSSDDFIFEGKAYLYLGSASGPSTTPAWSAEGGSFAAAFGISVAAAGDVNADGYSDVIIGAGNQSNGEYAEGRAYVYHGSPSGLSPTPAWTVESNQLGAQLGNAIAGAGDVNGDGYSDVIVGAEFFSNGQSQEGTAYLYLGSPSGLSPTPAWSAESDQVDARLGHAVATAGDVNGDGYADVIVGAYAYDTPVDAAGRAYVYLGSATGLSPTAAWIAEADRSALFGGSVGTAGDVNGDGYADVIVGATAYTNGEASEGRTFVYLGSTVGLSSTPSWTAEGNQINATFGSAVGTAGDVNGDGYADVIVGASFYDNGQADEGRAYLFLGSATGLLSSPTWTAESDQVSAWFGQAAAAAGDVNGDGHSDVIVGSFQYDNGQTDEGRALLFLGSASTLTPGAVWMVTSDQVDAQFAWSVSTAGDVNGDGYSDVIVGAPYYDNGETDEGRAYLHLGSAAGLGATPAWTAESNQADAQFGKVVATAGDVNGDGYSDVLVGAYGYDNDQTDEGRVYLYLGSTSGLASTPAWMAEGDQAGAAFGGAAATAGDVNGDGYSDVVIGAYGFDNDQTDEGRVFFFLGSASGAPLNPAWTVESFGPNARFGFSVATAGDVNGDGHADVIVGAPGFDNENGRTFLFLGSATGPIQAWTTFVGEPRRFGYSVATAGDVNGDGLADVIVGESQVFGFWGGNAYVFLGSATGSYLNGPVILTDTSSFADFGVSVSSAGDVNGDGYSDVLVGEPFYTQAGMLGRALLFLGSASGPAITPAWTVLGNENARGLGYPVAAAGDLNGDGYGDVLIGSVEPTLTSMTTSALVYYGGGGDGLDRIPRQARSDATTPIALHGRSDSETGFRLREKGQTPAGRGKIRLQYEVKPLGTPFNGAGLVTSQTQDTGEPGASGSAFAFDESIAGLSEGTFYHWRSRIVSTDPVFPRSPWMSLAGDGTTLTKLRTGGCVDRDGDGYGDLGDPSCVSLVADCGDQYAGMWGTPGETTNLAFTSTTTLSWGPPPDPGAPVSDLYYDTLRSDAPNDFLAATCVESNDGPNTTATDDTLPAAGQVLFYLTRAQNLCPYPAGLGSLGTNSSGTPRVGVSCP